MDPRLSQLFAKVDAFFARVEARHGEQLSCRAGCHACCAEGLTVTGVEAAAIREWLGERTLEPAAAGCAALDCEGRCRIYPVRPLVCRSHGLPIKVRATGHLPVISHCELNFKSGEPDGDCVLDQETLSTILAAIDAAHADAAGQPRGQRFGIRDLVR